MTPQPAPVAVPPFMVVSYAPIKKHALDVQLIIQLMEPVHRSVITAVRPAIYTPTTAPTAKKTGH